MRNLVKLLGFTALIAVIGLLFSTCIDPTDTTGDGTALFVIEFQRVQGYNEEGWAGKYDITSWVTNGIITKGDVYTLRYTFKSDVAIAGDMYICLADDGSTGWKELSGYQDLLWYEAAANTRVSGTVNLVADESSSSGWPRKISLEFFVGTDLIAAGKPTLTFTKFSLDKTASERDGIKSMTFARAGFGYDHWEYEYNIPSSVTGDQIAEGDIYTLTYAFKSKVDIVKLQVQLVDNSETAVGGSYWNELSEIQNITGITANTTVSGSITLTATGTASSAATAANKMFFTVNPPTDATGEPTLTFTTFSLVKDAP